MRQRDAHELMRAAWFRRRESFEVDGQERTEMLQQSATELEQAAELSREVPVDFAQALHLLANVCIDLGDRDRAETLWIEAISVLETCEAPLQLAHKVRHLGDFRFDGGQLKEAEKLYETALTLYREHASSESLDFANALRRMALLQEKRGDLERARALWSETRELYAAVGLAQGVEEADVHLAQLAP
ncbi:MAG: tetratricopeptide repeat protein [Rhodothermales bacterium]|nr:tetratricopeptide repeat protein [Rhodothermales bacterium]